MESKNVLRQKAKYIRKTLPIEEKSFFMVAKIRELVEYKSAQNVMIYYPMRYELNLLALLNDTKNFYLPRVCGENLQICPFKKGDKLIKSNFNVCEPCSNPIDTRTLDLIIVPALMADKDRFRLGYGGGFYDRFLVKNPEIPTILPIAEELYVDKLPHEKFDVRVERVLKV